MVIFITLIEESNIGKIDLERVMEYKKLFMDNLSENKGNDS